MNFYKYKVEKKNKTHTSINPPGCYTITNMDDNFLDFYWKVIESGHTGLIERPLNKTDNIVLLDIDLEQSKSDRQLTKGNIKTLVNLHFNTIKKFLDLNEPIKYYIQLRSAPYKNPKNPSIYKDGLHLIVPNLRLPIEILYKIRESLINDDKIKQLFSKWNKPLKDIIDESIIIQNGWYMYGSYKKGLEPYVNRYVFNPYTLGDEFIEITKEETLEDKKKFTKYFSIRNMDNIKYELTDLGKQILNDKKKEDTKNKRKVIQNNDTNINESNNTQNTKYNRIKDLVNILSNERANNELTWMEVGWCLFNIDDNLLDLWIDFSKRSNKFVEGECEKKWNKMKKSNYTEGSLHYWCKKDNITTYLELIIPDYLILIDKLIKHKGSDKCFAQLIHKLLEDNFIYCTDLDVFYKLNDYGFWKIDKRNIELQKYLPEIVVNILLEARKYYDTLRQKTGKSIYITKSNELTKLMIMIESSNKIKSVILQLKSYLHYPNLASKFDNNRNIIGFNNGIYDLNLQSFRRATKNDFITMSTKYDYQNERDEIIEKEVINFFSQIITKKEIRDYFLTLLSLCLEGKNNEEIFVILSGVGCNGKGKTCLLMHETFGDYAGVLDAKHIQMTKNGDNNGASPEQFRVLYKRFVYSMEPKKNTPFDCDMIKKLTGGDKIVVRTLYKDPIEVIPHFILFVQLNTCPKIDDDSNGIVRRLNNIEFTSKFVENPKFDYEFKIDTTLSSKFEKWRISFFHILTDYYFNYKNDFLNKGKSLKDMMPKEIKETSKQLIFREDPYRDWYDNHIIQCDNSVVTLKNSWDNFLCWYTKNHESYDLKINDLKRTILKNKLSFWLGKKPLLQKRINKIKYKNVWCDFKLIEDNGSMFDDDVIDNN